MDGRGRAFDNIFVEQLWRSVTLEDVYPKGYARIGEFMVDGFVKSLKIAILLPVTH
jgi:hypothetical protein